MEKRYISMEVDHGSDRAWSMGNANLWTWMIKLSGTKNKHGIVPFFRDIRYGKMSKKRSFDLCIFYGGAYGVRVVDIHFCLILRRILHFGYDVTPDFTPKQRKLSLVRISFLSEHKGWSENRVFGSIFALFYGIFLIYGF